MLDEGDELFNEIKEIEFPFKTAMPPMPLYAGAGAYSGKSLPSMQGE